MKKLFSLVSLFVAVVVFLMVQSLGAQDRLPVKVKASETITGVVIVHVQNGKRTVDLQCNEGANSCVALPSGDYLMVRLAKNFGMYDCQNVELFRGEMDKPEAAQKVGSYCLVES